MLLPPLAPVKSRHRRLRLIAFAELTLELVREVGRVGLPLQRQHVHYAPLARHLRPPKDGGIAGPDCSALWPLTGELSLSLPPWRRRK